MLMSFNVITHQAYEKKKTCGKTQFQNITAGVSSVGLVFKRLVPLSLALHQDISYHASLIAYY
jgi:hypothetical protein